MQKELAGLRSNQDDMKRHQAQLESPKGGVDTQEVEALMSRLDQHEEVLEQLQSGGGFLARIQAQETVFAKFQVRHEELGSQVAQLMGQEEARQLAMPKP